MRAIDKMHQELNANALFEMRKEIEELKSENKLLRENPRLILDREEYINQIAELQKDNLIMGQALFFFQDVMNYVVADGMSPADKRCKVMRDGRSIARHALQEAGRIK